MKKKRLKTSTGNDCEGVVVLKLVKIHHFFYPFPPFERFIFIEIRHIVIVWGAMLEIQCFASRLMGERVRYYYVCRVGRVISEA